MTSPQQYIRLFVTIVFLTIASAAHSQSTDNERNIVIETIVEEIIAENEHLAEQDEIIKDLVYFSSHPININTATQEELETLLFLSDVQIAALLNYRDRYGTIYSLYELQFVNSFIKKDISRLIAFVECSEAKESLLSTAKIKYGRHKILLRTNGVIEQAEGYSNNKDNTYTGNRIKGLLKYSFSQGKNIKIGLTAEKDAGEAFFGKSQPRGFDFYSAHLFLSGKGTIAKLAVGDFSARFGQGLAMWQGYGSSKSSLSLNLRKRNQGIKQYSSTDEINFCRGIGTTLRIGTLQISPFFSYKSKDASLNPADTILNTQTISNIQKTGIHATENQLENKNNIREYIYGVNVSYSFDRLKIGATTVKSGLNLPLDNTYTPYARYRNIQDKSLVFSADYFYSINNIQLFGELASNSNFNTACINGAAVQLLPQVSLSLFHRSFSEKYYSQFASALGEQGQIGNEKGFYSGIELRPLPYFSILAYTDLYQFPWISYRNNNPTRGKDYLFKVHYFNNNIVNVYLKIKYENRPFSESGDIKGIKKSYEQEKSSYRLHLITKVNQYLQLKNRIELTRYHYQTVNEKGFLFYQDLKYSSPSLPLSVSVRLAFFSTDDYNSRVYAYEDDVYLSFSVPAYYAKGIRTYLLCKYSITNNIDFWIRLSQTKYNNKDQIGSGLNLIDKNRKTDLKLQFMINI